MKCPFCFNDESKVVDSRSTDDNTTIRRRRECTKCNKRYTTYEKIEDIPGNPDYIHTKWGVGYYFKA